MRLAFNSTLCAILSAGRGRWQNLATNLQRQSVHEGRHKPSQGWYTGSSPVKKWKKWGQSSLLTQSDALLAKKIENMRP
jgi:hypothetical protein